MSRKLLFVVSGFLASLVLAEIVLRIFPVATGYGYKPVNAEEPVLRGTALAPYTYSLGWNFRRVSHGMLNNDGFISDRNYKPSVGNGVLLVGDSYVQAAAVPENLNLHAQLATRLRPVEVAGISRAGGALPDYVAMARWGVARYHTGVLIVLIVSGDVADSLTPKTGGYYFQQTAQGYVQTRVDRAPLGCVQETLNKSMLFRYLYDNLAFTVNFPTRPQIPAIAVAGDMAKQEKYGQVCEFFLGHLLQILPREKIVLLIHRSRKSGTFVYDTDVDVLRDNALQRGFRVLDLGPLFTEYEGRNRQRLDSSPVDTHWNILAQQFVADELAPQLRDILHDGGSERVPR